MANATETATHVTIDAGYFKNTSACYRRDQKMLDAFRRILGRKEPGDFSAAFDAAKSVVSAFRALGADARVILKALDSAGDNADPDVILSQAQETQALVETMARCGGNYTPPDGSGFDKGLSASTIARNVLGTGATAAQIRKTFANSPS